MDPVSGLSLAAAIAQFVGIGVKVIQRLNDFAPATQTQVFKEAKIKLPLLLKGIQQLKYNTRTDDISSLAQVLNACLLDIHDLDDILRKVSPCDQDSLVDRSVKAFTSLRHEKRIKQIEQKISGYIEALTFHQSIDNRRRPGFEERPKEQDVFWIVPFGRNSSFVGRDRVFAEIEGKLAAVQEGSQPAVALYGLGGIGKSQIALEYCYRRRNRDARCSIFWCNAATTARFEESLIRIANECGLISKEEAAGDAAMLLKDWLQFRHQRSWLMVIDNVDDKDFFFNQRMNNGKTPSEFVPQCAKGALLFTTRNREVAVDVAQQAQPIVVHRLATSEGLELTRKRLPENTAEALALELLEELEYIPLAITQASAFIAKRGKTVHYYLEQYRKSDETRTRLLSHEFSDHGREEATMDSLAKTWMLSFEAIREENARAAELLCLMSFFQHQGVPAILLQNKGEDEFDFQEAASLLEAYSFVDADDTESHFATHRLVQLATRWWLGRECPSGAATWAAKALESVSTLFPDPYSNFNAEYFSLCEVLLPHAELMLLYDFGTTMGAVEPVKARLLNSTGRYIAWVDSHENARSRFELSFHLNSKHFGEKHVDTMTSAALLGWLLAVYLKDPRAVPILERLVDNREDVLGTNDPRTIDATSDLSTAIGQAGDWPKAEALQREALSRSFVVLGRTHDETMNCMSFLADALLAQRKIIGKRSEYFSLRREVYLTKLKSRGPLDRQVLLAMSLMLVEVGLTETSEQEACELYRDCIEKTRNVAGVDHQATLSTVKNFGFFLQAKNRFEEAEQLYVQTLSEIKNGPREGLAGTQRHTAAMKKALHDIRQRANACERSAKEEGNFCIG